MRVRTALAVALFAGLLAAPAVPAFANEICSDIDADGSWGPLPGRRVCVDVPL